MKVGMEIVQYMLKRIKYKPNGPVVMGLTDLDCWADMGMVQRSLKPIANGYSKGP